MEKNKLFLLLRKFTDKELIRFELFLKSPYFNTDTSLFLTFETIKTFLKEDFKKENIKPALFAAAYPDQPYDKKKMGYLLSDLNQLAEHFLAIEAVKKEPYTLPLTLLNTLSERGLEKAYRQTDRQLKQKINQTPHKDANQLLNEFKWAEIKEQHFRRTQQRKHDHTIQLVVNQLDRYYYLHRLSLTCLMLDRQAIFKGNYVLNLSPEWIQHLKQYGFFQEPSIRIYYCIYQSLIEEGEEKYFEQLKTYLKTYQDQLSEHDLEHFYLFGINYCARKIRMGVDRFTEEALLLYQDGIKSGILLNNGQISPWTFTNVVKLSLRLEKFEWIEAFIHRNAEKLPKKFRDNALHYNLAELYYYTKRFELAQHHLTQVNFSDLNYYLGGRVLLSKIFYEIKEEESLLSLLASFTIFLKRNKNISSDLKHTYLNFCQILIQILKKQAKKEVEILSQIQQSKLLTDRKWLHQILSH